jgi:hypothetical protein
MQNELATSLHKRRVKKHVQTMVSVGNGSWEISLYVESKVNIIRLILRWSWAL